MNTPSITELREIIEPWEGMARRLLSGGDTEGAERLLRGGQAAAMLHNTPLTSHQRDGFTAYMNEGYPPEDVIEGIHMTRRQNIRDGLER